MSTLTIGAKKISPMTKRFHGIQITTVCLIISVCSISNAQTKIRILTPKTGAEVGSIEDFTGKITENGQPFLLVRPILEKVAATPKQKNPWWIQKNCRVDSRGNFSCQVHFGNAITKDKTKFEVMGILVSHGAFSKSLREQYSIEEVPRNTALFSRTSTFELSKTKAPATPNKFVIYPTQDDLVGRRETLNGIIPKYGTPVVFVKAQEEEIWWVQSIIQPSIDGGFKCDLYFGNENTPNKSKFDIAVAVIEDQDAQKLIKGSTMAKLPRDHLGLQMVTVQLEHQITLRNATRKLRSK